MAMNQLRMHFSFMPFRKKADTLEVGEDDTRFKQYYVTLFIMMIMK